MPVGLRSRVPAKITSCMFTPRSDRADCSPSTHEIASEMFDLPQPFGPTIAAMPSPSNFSSVRSQNDLKPRICSFFSLSNFHSFLRALLSARKATGSGQNGKYWSEHHSYFSSEQGRGQDRKRNIL